MYPICGAYVARIVIGVVAFLFASMIFRIRRPMRSICLCGVAVEHKDRNTALAHTCVDVLAVGFSF